MKRPIKSLIFNTAQLNLYSYGNSKWLHVYTFGEGQMVNKFDLSKAKIETTLQLDTEGIEVPSYWQISSSSFRVKIKLKKLDNLLVKGSITIYLFGVLPIYWCKLSGKKSLFSELHVLTCV